MSRADPPPAAADHLETGVPNLDRILGGGLLRGSLALALGPPGAGKTVLAWQVACHTARAGRAVLYLTGYSEPHQKLLAHNRGLRFFDPALLGATIQLLSLPDLLREGGEAAARAIVAEARARRAGLVVLDGFRGLRAFLAAEPAAPEFLYTLSAALGQLGVVTLVLLEGEPEERARFAELTTADVVLALRRERRGGRHRRLVEVLKVRGAGALDGLHPFVLDADGLSVSPRAEAVVAPAEPAAPAGRAAFGVAGLDAMLGGGLGAGTATLVAGSLGAGKTTLGLHFLAAGAARGEPGLFLGFMESPAQLRAVARTFGLAAAAEDDGRLRFLVRPAYDLEGDRLAELVRRDVEERGVRRLVIDSAAELARAAGDAAREPDFLAAFARDLRGRGVTTYLALDVATIVGPELSFAGTPLSVLAENVLLLRLTEYRGRLRRFLTVLKMRFSAYDPAIHEYTIAADAGVTVTGPAPAAAGLLTGLARPPERADPERPDPERPGAADPAPTAPAPDGGG